jgi:hypothetical protein
VNQTNDEKNDKRRWDKEYLMMMIVMKNPKYCIQNLTNRRAYVLPSLV